MSDQDTFKVSSAIMLFWIASGVLGSAGFGFVYGTGLTLIVSGFWCAGTAWLLFCMMVVMKRDA